MVAQKQEIARLFWGKRGARSGVHEKVLERERERERESHSFFWRSGRLASFPLLGNVPISAERGIALAIFKLSRRGFSVCFFVGSPSYGWMSVGRAC